MKLPKITNEDPSVLLKAKMPESKVKMLEEYCEYYKKVYSETLEPSKFIEHLVEEFISSDKQFLNHLKEKKVEVKTES